MKLKQKTIKYTFILTISIILVTLYVFLQKQQIKKIQTTNVNVQTNENDIVIGHTDAPQTMYVYFSYTSSDARDFYNNTYPILKKNYIDKGKLTLVIKMVEIYEKPEMMLAEQVAICLNKFGKLDAYHELLLYNPDVVYSKEFVEMVDGYMFDNANMANCILDNEHFPDIKKNNEEFYSLNGKKIPLFVIENKIINKFKSDKELLKLIEQNINN